MYQIGSAQMPSDTDPYTESLTEALRIAREQAVGERVVAIWLWHGEAARTEYLVYQGDVFAPQDRAALAERI